MRPDQRSDADTAEEVDQPGVVVEPTSIASAMSSAAVATSAATIRRRSSVARITHTRATINGNSPPALSSTMTITAAQANDHRKNGTGATCTPPATNAHGTSPSSAASDGRAVERPVAAEDRHERGAHRGERQHERGRQLRRLAALAVVRHAATIRGLSAPVTGPQDGVDRDRRPVAPVSHRRGDRATNRPRSDAGDGRPADDRHDRHRWRRCPRRSRCSLDSANSPSVGADWCCRSPCCSWSSPPSSARARSACSRRRVRGPVIGERPGRRGLDARLRRRRARPRARRHGGRRRRRRAGARPRPATPSPTRRRRRRSRRGGVVLEPRPTAAAAQRQRRRARWCSCASTTARSAAEDIVDEVRDAVEGDQGGLTSASVAAKRCPPTSTSDDDRRRPRPRRADRHPDHARPAGARVRRSRRGLAPAVRRRARRPRHVPVAVRDRLAHRRVGLRHQPDHRPRARPGHRLQPVHRLPLPRGAAQRRAASSDAVVRAVETAGRTIAISALTVGRVARRRCSCSRSTSCARSPTPASPSCCWRWSASIVALPALLAVVGHRIDSLRVCAGTAPRPEEDGFWYRMATRVMRRPVPVAVGVVAVLLLLGSPFLRVQFGTPDDRVLPESAPLAEVSAILRTDFEGDASESFPVVVTGIAGDVDGALADVAERVSALAGVARVETAPGRSPAARSTSTAGPTPPATPDRTPAGCRSCRRSRWRRAEGERLVREIRGLDTDRVDVLSAGRPPSSSTPRRRSSNACRWPSGSSWSPRSCCCSCSPAACSCRSRRSCSTCSASRPRSARWCGSSRTATSAGLLGFTATGADRHVDADPHVLHRLRAVDGLRGVPALPDQGGARPHRRQRPRRRPRSGAHRPHRHGRGAAAVGHVLRLRHVWRQLHQDVRHRPGHRRADGRLRHPRHPRAGVHEARRRGQLVGARLRCVASTTASAFRKLPVRLDRRKCGPTNPRSADRPDPPRQPEAALTTRRGG